MNRSLFLSLLCATWGFTACAQADPAADPSKSVSKRRPNVLLIMTDDQGYGDISSHNNPNVDTPTLDQLAKDGARFDQFMVSPMCAPTRAALLTGRFPLRVGVHGVTRGREVIHPDETTLGELFKQSGYATGIFGKWHNGEHYPYTPNGRGFDEFLGFTAGHWENYFDPELLHNNNMVRTKGYITDVLTDAAIQFIEGHREHPFFCYVPFNAPHGPWQLPDEYFNKYKQRGLDNTTASAYGMVDNLDVNIDRLLNTLDTNGLADNTIVIFLTDNGPNSDRYNANMRGRKGDVHEGGVRVPLFIRWPGHISPGQVIDSVVAHVDLLPTLQALCGLSETQKTLDGRDLTPLLMGVEAPEWSDRNLLYYAWSRAGVRTERWRAVKDGKRSWELYDMIADPGQRKDVAGDYPEVVRELAGTFEQYYQETGYESLRPFPIPVGHEEVSTVTLPSHEAELHPDAHGNGISYVTGAGWAGEWIKNWTRTDAFAQWQIDVQAAGKYRVTLLYACNPSSVGVELEIVGSKQSLRVRFDRPHDVQRIDAKDRVRKKKTYVQGWGEQPAGQLQLDAGVQALRVYTRTMSGKESIMLKGVRIERVTDSAP